MSTRINTLVFCCLFWTSSAIAHVAVIVNPHNSVTTLSRDTLRTIFAMRTPFWPDGTPVRVYVFHDQYPLHIDFCKHNLAMFPYQLRRIWDRQVYSGTGVAPYIVSSEQEMHDAIAQDTGAIGYIQPDSITPAVRVIQEKP